MSSIPTDAAVIARPRPRFLALVPVLVLLATTLPFAAKPLHVDDPMFVAMADAIRRDPAAPYAFRAVWNEVEEDGARIVASPPFYAYLLAAARAVFGESEAIVRLAALPFALLLLLALRALARRFDVPAWALSILVVSAPVFVVMGQMAMPDIVLGALVASALAAFVSGMDEARVLHLVAAGVALGLAILTRYNVLALIPVLFAYAWLRRGGYARALVPIAVALGLFAGWNVYTQAAMGEAHFLATLRYAGSEPGFGAAAQRILATIAAVGGVTVFPLALVAGYAGTRRRRLAVAALLSSGAIAVGILAALEWAPAVAVLLAPLFVVAGGLVLGDAVLVSVRGLVRRLRGSAADDAFLALWLLAILAPLAIYVHSAAKYLLAALAPLVLLFLRRASPGPRHVAAAAAASVALGLLLAHADYGIATLYHDAARTTAIAGAERPLRFGGHWGWQYYLEAAGARPLTRDGADLRAGDTVVIAHDTSPRNVPADFQERAELVREIALPLMTPVRLMDRSAWAGFYSSSWGLLPFSVVTPGTIADRVSIYRVVR